MPDEIGPAYRDPSLPTKRRVEDLLERMSLEEKIAQLGSIPASELLTDGKFDRERAEEVLAGGTGQITRIGGEGNLLPRDAAEVANAAQGVLADTRLGIPAVPHEECLSGYMGPGGTTFPQSIGLASTWSPDLVEEITTEIRRQLRAIGAVHALSPVVDLARDHRWGRTEETFGEDQYLVARMGCAYVSGLQGDDPETGISATLKHFVGHGTPQGGKNRASVSLGPRALREHLFPFEAAVTEAGAESVMNAYHDLDGVPCGSSKRLLTGILREEWGFGGVVVADYGTVTKLRTEHGVAADDREAAIMALEAGIDVELSSIDAYEELVGAVEDGAIAEETVDESVRRVLRAKFRKGLFEADPVDLDAVDEVFETDVQRSLARRAARESVTLLQNRTGVLPLEDVESIAAIGPKADATEGLLGDYAYLAHFPEINDDEAGIDIVSPLSALEDRLGPEAVTHAPGCTLTGLATDRIDEAVAAAEDADVAVAFVGANSTIDFSDADDDRRRQPTVSTSGEGRDVTDLGLPGVQERLVEAVVETDTPVVAVVVSGKPHALTNIAEDVSTIIHAWLPGEEGGAGTADVLFGDHSPSGHLPVSLPRDAGQLPINYNRNPNAVSGDYVYTPADALFPFGHGESYATFEYGDLELAADAVGPAGTIEASVVVENVGDRAGHEVVQWYSRARNPPLARPVQQLQAFERVFLEPGERARNAVEIGTAQLAFLVEAEELAVHPSEYELRVGRSAADIRANAGFEIVGEKKRVPPSGKRFFSETHVE